MPDRFLARLARGAGYVLTGSAPAKLANRGDWFGPQQPLPPQAPPDVAGRAFDYPFGFNLAVTPRSWERTGFAELRGLADSYDLLRAVIETRKDQMERLTWRIRPRALSGGATDNDPRLVLLTQFFASPDKQHGWATWLRMLLEDLLVIDAPTLYKRRSRGGALYALEVLDGATIKRLIDDWGRTPAPPASAYQQILKGMPAVDYSADELIYAPRNPRIHKAYGFSPVEQVQMSVNIALRRQIYQLQYYTEGNVPEALIGVPESWNPDQIRQFQAYWDSLNAGDTAERRHAKFVPGGVAKTFVPVREPAMKDAFDEWLARVVCYTFSLPPSAFTAQVNRATAENAQDVSLAEGLAPLQNWVKHLIDRVLAAEFGAADLEFAWDADRDADPAQMATIATDYVKAGIKSINEVRAELGLPPVAGGEQPKIQTAQGLVPLTQTASAAPAAAPAKTAAVGKTGFDPNQPRDDDGRWSSDGEHDSQSDADSKPHQVAQEEPDVPFEEPPVPVRPPLPNYPTDPTKPPGPGYEWRGTNPQPGSPEGSWYNENTKEALRPDIDHPDPEGPHWDYKAPDGTWYRWFPDGRFIPKYPVA
ncbi:MAG TPA: phage portal protein [Stellaceae bacterium]|jgi:HK97 family phage portal protein